MLFLLIGLIGLFAVIFLIEGISIAFGPETNGKCKGHKWESVDLGNGSEKLRCKQCGKTFPEILYEK